MASRSVRPLGVSPQLLRDAGELLCRALQCPFETAEESRQPAPAAAWKENEGRGQELASLIQSLRQSWSGGPTRAMIASTRAFAPSRWRLSKSWILSFFLFDQVD